MVSFNNIVVNQPVEVRRCGSIFKGVVKYKGSLNGIPGDWVGVELTLAAGDHDGMLNGRRYFSCLDGHGVFTQAHEIRFPRLKRRLYNRYRSLKKSQQQDKSNTMYPSEESGGMVSFSLSHTVGGQIPANAMRRPSTARASFSYSSSPIHCEYEDDSQDFISAPSIPNIHMPYEALRQQERRGWEHAPLVREWSVHTARHSLVYSSLSTLP